MAEVAGLVLGSLGVLSVFKDAVDSFEYVQIGKGMGRDYQTSQLRLDAARVSLSRWGKSIGLDDANHDKTLTQLGLKEADVHQAESWLEQIQDLFDEAKTRSDKYVSRAQKNTKQLDAGHADASASTSTSLVPYQPGSDLKGGYATLHTQMSQLSIARRGSFRKRDRVRWALFEAKEYDRLVQDIGEMVEKLVLRFPAAQPVQKQLAEAEVQAFKDADPETVPIAKEVALEVDKALKEALDKALSAAGDHRSYTNTANFYGDHNTGVQIGQQFGGTATYHLGGGGGGGGGGR